MEFPTHEIDPYLINVDDLAMGVVPFTHRVPFFAPIHEHDIMIALGYSRIAEITYDWKENLQERIKATMLIDSTDEIHNQIQRLSGPSDAQAYFEFLKLAVFFSSNGFSNLSDGEGILDWITRQTKTLLINVMQLNLLSVQAFLQYLIGLAVRTNDKSAGRFLLDCDKHQRLFQGHTDRLLLAAVRFDHLTLVRSLLNMNLDCNAIYNESDEESTLLNCAYSVDMANMLIQAGADVNAVSFGYEDICETPLAQAVRQCRIDLVRALLAAGADVDLHCNDPGESNNLTNAIHTGNVELVSLLLDAGATYRPHENASLDDFRWLTCLDFGVREGSLEMVKVLLGSEGVLHSIRSRKEQGALSAAAKRGDTDIVQCLIAAGADVNIGKNDYYDYIRIENTLEDGISEEWDYYVERPPLLAAIEAGHVNVVKLLIEHHVDVNAAGAGASSSNPLDAARIAGHDSISKLLSEAGAIGFSRSFNCYDSMEIQLAAIREDTHRVDTLVQMGIDPICILDQLHRELSYLYADSDSDFELWRRIFRTFMDVYGGDYNVRSPRFQATPLEIAVRIGDKRRAQWLVQHGASPVVDLSPELAEGYHSFIELVLLTRHILLAKAVLPTDAGYVASTIDLIKLMLKKGAILESPGRSVLAMAIEHEWDIDMIKFFVTEGAQVNPDWGESLLQTALGAPKTKTGRRIADYLLLEGANVNAPPRIPSGPPASPRRYLLRGTALQLAIYYHHDLSLIKRLLELGADINAPAVQGNVGLAHTALQVAIKEHPWRQEYTELIQLLLSKGADVNAPAAEKGGRTALQAAVSWGPGDVKLINLLLNNGADVNAPPARERGITALQAAAIKGYMNAARLLLQHGADVNAPGSKEEGRTALEGAAEWGRLDMVQLLLNNGATASETAANFAKEEGYFVIYDLIMKNIR